MASLDLLETERLVLSGWRADQIGDLMRLHGDPVVTRYFTHVEPWTEARAIAALGEWMALFTEQQTLASSAYDENRMAFWLAAPATASMRRPANLNWAMRSIRSTGVTATPPRAASGLRDWIFRETDWDHFIGIADIRNRASLAVLARIGMTRTHIVPNEFGRPCQFHIYRKPMS